MAYDNTDRGVLFKNEKKETDNHPDYTGNLNVGGAEFWLSAWIKTSESGRKYMSLSVKVKETVPAKGNKPAPRRGNQDDPPF